MSEGSKSSEGIEEWTGSAMASRRRRNGGAHLDGEEETVKGRHFPPALALIVRGEREGGGGEVLVPHVGDSRLTAHRRPCFGSMMGGPRSAI
jgi:hypothetical protein